MPFTIEVIDVKKTGDDGEEIFLQNYETIHVLWPWLFFRQFFLIVVNVCFFYKSMSFYAIDVDVHYVQLCNYIVDTELILRLR